MTDKDKLIQHIRYTSKPFLSYAMLLFNAIGEKRKLLREKRRQQRIKLKLIRRNHHVYYDRPANRF